MFNLICVSNSLWIPCSFLVGGTSCVAPGIHLHLVAAISVVSGALLKALIAVTCTALGVHLRVVDIRFITLD